MFHLQEVKAQLTDAHVKNRMKKITCCIFARFIFAKQGILLHMYKGQHFPKTCHEEILYLFHPLPSNNFQGDIEQNETCHLPTIRGKAASHLDQFRSPVLPCTLTPHLFPGTRTVMHTVQSGGAGQVCSTSFRFKPEGKWSGKRPWKKVW